MANEYKGVSCIIPVEFNLDTGNLTTAQDMPYAGGIEGDTPSATQGFVMPFDGCVVGMSACRTTGHGTSVVTAALNKGATLVSGATLAFGLTTDAADKVAYVRWMPNVYNFSAGDVVNVEVGATSSYDPGNIIVVVFIQIGKSGT